MNKRDKEQLRALLGPDQCTIDEAECWAYGYDNSTLHHAPEAVVFPLTISDIQAIVRFCYEGEIPLTARGKGTGTPGGSIPIHGGVVLSTERMTQIIRFEPENRLIEVMPGLTNEALQIFLGSHGFFWPPDPGSQVVSTIGGNLAYNSAGPRALKYGTPRENTLGLQVISGTGALIKTGADTTKHVVGYDLTRLMIGSEGTLGIIGSATLKLSPIAPEIRTSVAYFTSLEDATHAVVSVMSQPVIPTRCEFLDHYSLDLLRQHSDLAIPAEAQALLLIDVDGTADTIAHFSKAIFSVLEQTNPIHLETADGPDTSAALWRIRKSLSPLLKKLAPDKVNEDIVVPVGQVPAFVNGVIHLRRKYDAIIAVFGHIGNGNLHVNMMLDMSDPIQANNVQPYLSDLFDLVLSLKGALSGEHGIGLVKRPFLRREISDEAFELMRGIKSVFDPKGILNPGKLFSD